MQYLIIAVYNMTKHPLWNAKVTERKEFLVYQTDGRP